MDTLIEAMQGNWWWVFFGLCGGWPCGAFMIFALAANAPWQIKLAVPTITIIGKIVSGIAGGSDQ